MIAIKATAPSHQQGGDKLAGLLPVDQRHFLEFERRCDFIRDRVQSVAGKYQNGVYICGHAGCGKTHVVLETLQQIDARWIFRNCRMSPMGLYEELAAHPEHVVVLDDVPSLVDQRLALQILMAALGGKPGEPRTLTHTTKGKNGRRHTQFRGGIICVSNVPLRRDPLADAVASRLSILEHEPPDEELVAVIRHLALKGYEDLAPGECSEVAEFFIRESMASDYRIDLRGALKAWQDFRQHKHGNARRPWQELVRSSLKQLFRAERCGPISKEEEIESQRDQVRRLVEKYPGDRAQQLAESGLKHSTFYTRLKELKLSKNPRFQDSAI